jgi:hypothetical protein
MSIIISKSFVIVLIFTLVITSGFALWSYTNYYQTPSQPSPTQPQAETIPTLTGTVTISGEHYTFEPLKVETVRSDIFNTGFFSMFDVLVHLDKQGSINLEYHFDASMNTHIIDSLNDEPYWWYRTYYSGGWLEDNVFRPDHYPWKDGTTLIFYQLESSIHLENIYAVWREEIVRRTQNNGQLILPKVMITGKSFSKVFENVEIHPHNLRNDMFRDNVTTAIDVIQSLGDQEKITFELQWYESIGTAQVVKNYWVESIDGEQSIGRCGFVYEAGAFQYTFFQGNHIHLPSDIRVLNSPEYVEFFWICI